jgi:hypothetical protein
MYFLKTSERHHPTTAFAALALCALGLPATSVAAQNQNANPDIGDVAMTPLSDLNLSRKDIPAILQRVIKDPYSTEHLVTCNGILAEVLHLNEVLGEDYDEVEQSKSGVNVGRAAQSVIGSIIPFRGLVREVSGAAGNERDLRAAYTAGMVRRGFVKGIGLERGCDLPARPRERPPTEIEDETAEAGEE